MERSKVPARVVEGLSKAIYMVHAGFKMQGLSLSQTLSLRHSASLSLNRICLSLSTWWGAGGLTAASGRSSRRRTSWRSASTGPRGPRTGPSRQRRTPPCPARSTARLFCCLGVSSCVPGGVCMGGYPDPVWLPSLRGLGAGVECGVWGLGLRLRV